MEQTYRKRGNNSGDDAIDVNALDILQATLDSAGWTCTATGIASGTDDITNLGQAQFILACACPYSTFRQDHLRAEMHVPAWPI